MKWFLKTNSLIALLDIIILDFSGGGKRRVWKGPGKIELKKLLTKGMIIVIGIVIR